MSTTTSSSIACEPVAAIVFSNLRDGQWARDELVTRCKLLDEPIATSSAGTWPLVMRTNYKNTLGVKVPLILVFADNDARGLYNIASNLPRDIAVVHCGGAASQDLALGSVASVQQTREYNFAAALDDSEYEGGKFESYGSFGGYAALGMGGTLQPVAQAISSTGIVCKSSITYERAIKWVGTPALLDMDSHAFYAEFDSKWRLPRMLAVRGIWNRADKDKSRDEATWREPTIRLAALYALHAALVLSVGAEMTTTNQRVLSKSDCDNANLSLLIKIYAQTEALTMIRRTTTQQIILSEKATTIQDVKTKDLLERSKFLHGMAAEALKRATECDEEIEDIRKRARPNCV